MPKVSVIIPVYKVEAYLPACMDSVLGQSLQDIEAICIDDASPDRCGEILDQYAARDPRVRVLHLRENHMQGYGRNRGLRMARGEYVYFLDSDDMIAPTAMEELYALSQRDGLDGVFFDSGVVFESEELERKNQGYQTRRQGEYEDRVYGGQELLDTLFAQKEWDCYVQREFWRREYLLREGIFFPERTEHEDEYFAFAAVLLAGRMRLVKEPYFIRRYRENSVMTRPAHPKDFHGYFVNYCMMTRLVEERGIESYGAERNIAHIYRLMLRHYPLFSQEADPGSWFKEGEERRAFWFFVHSQRLDLLEQDRIRDLKEAIPEGSRLWIYGAGILGSAACRSLEAAGYVIKGFVVTSREGNPDALLSREVFPVDQAPILDTDIVVVAAAKAYREEMIGVLKERGLSWRVYTGGR